MCEACGPDVPEHVDPELMAKFRERSREAAKRRGITLEQYEKAEVRKPGQSLVVMVSGGTSES